MQAKSARESRAVKAAMVLTPDANHHGTMFGGRVMAYIDDIAALSATRHARMPVVTASTDSVDFLHPVQIGQSVCLEAFVSWTHKTSLEVFVKVVAEDLISGERNVCTTAFLTFVAIDDAGHPQPVPPVIPESELERFLHEGGPGRAAARRTRRDLSKQLAARFGTQPGWRQHEW